MKNNIIYIIFTLSLTYLTIGCDNSGPDSKGNNNLNPSSNSSQNAASNKDKITTQNTTSNKDLNKKIDCHLDDLKKIEFHGIYGIELDYPENSYFHLNSIVEIGADAHPYLLEILSTNRDGNLRAWVSSALFFSIGRIVYEKQVPLSVVEKLINFVEDHNISVSQHIEWALGKAVGGPFPNDAIDEMLKNPFPTKSQWQKWWKENKNYLYWSSYLSDVSDRKYYRYFIDKEAKKAGIPTEEYRKTYPWPKEKKK